MMADEPDQENKEPSEEKEAAGNEKYDPVVPGPVEETNGQAKVGSAPGGEEKELAEETSGPVEETNQIDRVKSDAEQGIKETGQIEPETSKSGYEKAEPEKTVSWNVNTEAGKSLSAIEKTGAEKSLSAIEKTLSANEPGDEMQESSDIDIMKMSDMEMDASEKDLTSGNDLGQASQEQNVELSEEDKAKAELRRMQEEEEKMKLEEENRALEERIKEIELQEQQDMLARKKLDEETELRRKNLLKRRDVNIERRNNLEYLKLGQGINKPWKFTYHVVWPKETYNITMGEPDKKKKGAKGKKK